MICILDCQVSSLDESNTCRDCVVDKFHVKICVLRANWGVVGCHDLVDF